MRQWDREILNKQAADLGLDGVDGKYTGVIDGYDISIIQHRPLSHLCGYVKASINNAEETIVCHGGITYDNGEWIGFDCAHCGDLIPQSYELFEGTELAITGETFKDVNYVYEELKSIVEQVSKC